MGRKIHGLAEIFEGGKNSKIPKKNFEAEKVIEASKKIILSSKKNSIASKFIL